MKKYILPLLIIISFFTHATKAQAQDGSIAKKIIIHNISNEIINGIRAHSTYKEHKDSIMQKTYITTGNQRSFSVKVWNKGDLKVRVHYRYNDKDILSQPYVVDLENSKNITDFILTFKGGAEGLWDAKKTPRIAP